MTFSRDGALLASASADKSIKVQKMGRKWSKPKAPPVKSQGIFNEKFGTLHRCFEWSSGNAKQESLEKSSSGSVGDPAMMRRYGNRLLLAARTH